MITINGKELKESHTFPGGEVRVQIDNEQFDKEYSSHIDVVARVKNSEDFIKLLHTLRILRLTYPDAIIRLKLPYLPYARQDRICSVGEMNGLQWALTMLQTHGVDQLTVFDVHNSNEYLHVLNDNGKLNSTMHVENISLADILSTNLKIIGNYDVIIVPDAGAKSKITNLVLYYNEMIKGINPAATEFYQLKMLAFEKVRDQQTGKILSINLDKVSEDLFESHPENYQGKRFLILDDICDGGGTFIRIGEVLKKYAKPSQMDLYVTHGIFSNDALSRLWNDGDYDKIITTDSFFDDVDYEELSETTDRRFLVRNFQIINL